MHISELDTPALVIDLDIMERNLRRMSEYAASHGLRLRPHTKTHKVPALGRLQLDLGAAGLTVAKVSEAEVMLASGVEDLLIAYPLYGPKKWPRVAEVAKKTRLTVSVDSYEVAEPLIPTGVEFLIEMDAGLGRVGVRPEEVVPLAKRIGTNIRGLAFYPGHLKSNDPAGLLQVSNLVQQVLREAAAAGIEFELVSGGSTPTMWQSHLVQGMNEMRPGTYIFNDRNTIASGACGPEDCAASILCTVVSTSVDDQMIIDGGSKTFTSDQTAAGGYGEVLGSPEAFFFKMNEEHGYIKRNGANFKVGDRARVLMNHVCVSVNMEERIYGVRGEEVVETWEVAGRGKLQ
ncbi:MAG: alanine racemase [Acidobacteriaceae bacterium]|nr:alanine racemase [Acidobacteriaceae bacterium]